MVFEDVHPTFRAALGAYEAFRCLGFASKDLFVCFSQGNILYILRAQGKEFGVRCGQVDLSEAEFATRWQAVAQGFNSMDHAEAQRLWVDFLARFNTVEFIAAILAKGFTLPYTERAAAQRIADRTFN